MLGGSIWRHKCVPAESLMTNFICASFLFDAAPLNVSVRVVVESTKDVEMGR